MGNIGSRVWGLRFRVLGFGLGSQGLGSTHSLGSTFCHHLGSCNSFFCGLGNLPTDCWVLDFPRLGDLGF